MATTSLVFGLCSFLLPFLSIPGVILGIVSLRRISRRPGLSGTGRSVAGIATSATLGPLAGTPFNLTTISYDGSLDMGLLVDPVAVESPGELRVCLEEAYGDLTRAAG